MRRFHRGRATALLLAAALVAVVVIPLPASAATRVGVDFTVAESIPVSGPGSLIASNIPGCASGSVDTFDASASTSGSVTTFRASKLIDCGGGDTITLRLIASVVGCAAFDVGLWRVSGGTGAFDGVRGGGFLIGTYTGGDACSATGIDDRYLGVMRIP